MAEGGIAAAMGNVYPDDNWRVHFRDTMRGGKMLNSWRMAQLHAQEAPDRVYELEEWGALFDRTDDGRILQRDFGGHRFARLAHVGDRTGLEMIRTLQHRAVAQGVEVFMECTVMRLLTSDGRIAGAVAYWRESGRLIVFKARSVVLATGGIGKAWKVTSNSWEYTGDGHALALWAGADLVDMEFVQFHPTGMVWPPSVRGILVTEGVRGDGGVLRNSEGRRFMFDYIPDMFRSETAETEEEADRWYDDRQNNRRTPTCCRVTRSPGPSTPRSRRPGSPHGGVFLDIASRKPADYIQRRLPSMYHQFKELADVDITKEPMEVGPTCHYVMGGIRVDPDTQAATVPGLFAAGEAAGGMHGANRLGGNSLSDLLVFGLRATTRPSTRPRSAPSRWSTRPRSRRPSARPWPRSSGPGRGEPLHRPAGAPGHHAGPGRDHPHRGRAEERPGADRRPQGAGGPGRGRGPPPVQSGLAPGPGPALAADRVRVRGPGGDRAPREPRRPHPRRLPKPDPELGKVKMVVRARDGKVGQPGAAGRDARGPASAVRGDAPFMTTTQNTTEDTAQDTSYDVTLRLWRGDQAGGELRDYTVACEDGEVVLDAIHRVQATQAGDLAVRWNCKAGKCGSCSAEVNGKPRLLCMTRLA